MALFPFEPWCIIKCFTAENESDFEILLEQRISLEDLNSYVQQKCGDTYRCYILRGSGTLRKLRRDSELQDMVQKCDKKIEIYVKKSRTLSQSTKQLSSPADQPNLDVLSIAFETQIEEDETIPKPAQKRGHRRTKSAHATCSNYIPELDSFSEFGNFCFGGKFVPAIRCSSPDSGFQSPECKQLTAGSSISPYGITPYDGDIPRHLTEEYPIETDKETSNIASLTSSALSQEGCKSEYDLTSIALPDGYLLKHLIGSGGFAKVYLCIDIDTGCDIAMKQVLFDSRCKHSKRELKALENEIKILKTLTHPNIVVYLGSSYVEESFNIFMEYISGGSMRSFIQSNGPLSTKFVVKCLKQVLSGLRYLHSQNIVHRDLKAANILRTSQGDIKIADFGASKQFDTLRSIHGTNTVVGTPYWMAPEVIKAESYNYKVDIWGVGVTVFEFLTGAPPFFHVEPLAAMFKIAQKQMKDELSFPETVPDLLKCFVLSCLEHDPDTRPNVDELLSHSLFVAPTP